MLLDIRKDCPPRDQQTNTFLALMPPREVAEQFHENAAKLCRRAGIVGNQRPSFILHMTLLPVRHWQGRLPAEFLERIDAALNMMRFPAFDIVLDEARSFDTRKDSVPFVLEGAELTDVEATRLAILAALRVRDLPIPRRSTFSPHMTLAYARRRSPRMRVEPFGWTAREVVLVESWVGATKYVKLARWRLWENPPGSGAPAQPAPYSHGAKPNWDGAACMN